MRKEDVVYRMMQDLDEMIKNHFQDAFLGALDAVPVGSDSQRAEQCMILLDAQKKHFAATLKQDTQRLTAVLK